MHRLTFTIDRLCRYVRIPHLSYHPFNSLNRWGVDHRELGALYHSNFPPFLPTYLILTRP